MRNPAFRLLLAGAAQFFARLTEEYAEATDGYRAKLYIFAQRCYRIGLGYTRKLKEFQKFKEDPFWADMRQKPKDDKIMRAVLVFTMKARSAKLASSITKIAKVLDSMAAQNIKPDEVAKRLKAGGGILKMYADLAPNRSDNGRVPDDLEILNPKFGEDDEEQEGEAYEPNEAEDESAKRPDKNQVSKPNANDPGPASRQSLTLANAANADPTITDFGGMATPPPSEPPRLKFDWARDLIVDLSKTSVTPEKARGMKKLLIIAVIEEIGDPDFFVCKAIKVRKARKGVGDDKDQAGDIDDDDNDIDDDDNRRPETD